MDEAKPFKIPKRDVWEAFKRVKANQGAAGVDGQSIAGFEANLSGNLYKLWNRLSSGSYFPTPVKRVEIPKANGGTRPLGIPTVADRIAQAFDPCALWRMIESRSAWRSIPVASAATFQSMPESALAIATSRDTRASLTVRAKAAERSGCSFLAHRKRHHHRPPGNTASPISPVGMAKSQEPRGRSERE